MLAVVFIAIVVTLFLVWPVVTTHRRQQQRFAAALDAVTDEPPSRSGTSVATKAVARAGAPDRTEAQEKLEEAGLGLIALSGRLAVALNAGELGADSLKSELIAVDAALANIEATLRQAAALAGAEHSTPRFDGLSHEVPTSLIFEIARLPDTPYALEDELHQRQSDALLAELKVAQGRSEQLERLRGELAKHLGER